MRRMLVALALVLVFIVPANTEASSSTPTHVDRAYAMAARALVVASHEHPLYPPFVADMLRYGIPSYSPDSFIGLWWRCGDETCFSGLLWRADGTRYFATGT